MDGFNCKVGFSALTRTAKDTIESNDMAKMGIKTFNGSIYLNGFILLTNPENSENQYITY